MNDGHAQQDMIAEFRRDDEFMRKAMELYPTWLKRQEAMKQLRDAFPKGFVGTYLEDWTPINLVLSVDDGGAANAAPLVDSQAGKVMSPLGAVPKSLPVPPELVEARSFRAVRDTNRAAAKLAEQVLRREWRPMTAEELAAQLDQEGWAGFPYLGNASPDDIKWTLYRTLQSRPTVFALCGKGGRWGLLDWPKEDGM